MTTVRPARAEDVQAVAELHVRSWHAAYRGIMPEALIATQDAEVRAVRWRETVETHPPFNFLVAVDGDGTVAGFCYASPVVHEPEDAGFDGRLYTIHVAPERARQGVGSSLVREAFRRLRARGCGTAIVWTLEDLAAARRFYEALGGRQVRSKMTDFDGTELPEVAYAFDLDGFR